MLFKKQDNKINEDLEGLSTQNRNLEVLYGPVNEEALFSYDYIGYDSEKLENIFKQY